MSYWRKVFSNHAQRDWRETTATLLQSLVLGQHLAVATQRFDGGKRRLRLSIEEEGLVWLAGDKWIPNLTPDLLAAAVSLMTDCGMIVEEPAGCFKVA